MHTCKRLNKLRLSNPEQKLAERSTYKIHIKGLVQGVGFRPFIYRLAVQNKLSGTVENSSNGVNIFLNTHLKKLDNFINQIRNEAPPVSKINSIEFFAQEFKYYDSFTIKKSENQSNEITEISPDIAVCKDCLRDLREQAHRIDYPFINCTNCGPRFTIVQDIPYDRNKTTMQEFPMCEICKKEYEDIMDRRFHAQPIACNHCGPTYSLHTRNKIVSNLHEIIEITARLISSGEVIAIKGMGGFHLMCDTYNDFAVKKLREIKKRDAKPFAVMCRDKETVRKITNIAETDLKLLESWQRPIILLRSKNKLSELVQNGLNSLGVMLPYMPIHYLLFEKFKTDTIVLTSGNFSDEPIIISNQIAIEQLLPENSAVLCYNREIYNRTDDSVVQSINNTISILRRSRGFAPGPLELNFNAEGVMAAGAELVNVFAIGKQKNAILSQYIGDLKNSETLEFYEESYSRFSSLFRFKPGIVACDLHPDYLSSHFAQNLAIEHNIPLIQVQHHHAHIASVMSEYKLNEKVIGICMDGVGLGTDGSIWGAEFMISDFSGFERVYHFDEILMAGGDAVSNQPWRSAVSYLIQTGNEDFIKEFIQKNSIQKKQEILFYAELIRKKINCQKYTSAGRLFDAVSALCGLCLTAGFHAEAPMRLESAIDESVLEHYTFEKKTIAVDFSKMFSEIVSDLRKKESAGTISAKFHNTIVDVINKLAQDIRTNSGLNKIVLSGGTFQNKYLAEKSINVLTKDGFEVYYPKQIPVNDGGIALGQMAIAAYKQNAQSLK